MTFTPAQIKQALEAIDFQHTFFVANNVSTRVLSADDSAIEEI